MTDQTLAQHVLIAIYREGHEDLGTSVHLLQEAGKHDEAYHMEKPGERRKVEV